MATKHQLAQLIDSVKAVNNWSDVKLAAIAEKKGYAVSKSNIGRFRKPLVSIKGEIIYMLADILGLSPSQVAVAAVESMGIPMPQYSTITPEVAVRLDAELSERDKQSILGLLGQFRIRPTASGWSTTSTTGPNCRSPGRVLSDRHAGDRRPDDGDGQ